MENERIHYYRVLLLIGIVLMCIGVQAREIQGKVIDKEGNPVHGASVVVMTLPDSVFSCTAVTDETGVVRFDSEMIDSVLVTVQMLGYERFQTAVSSDFSATLEPVSTQLQEVVVEAKPEFRTEAGKFVFTPGDLVNRVNNAQDILQYVPMVRVMDDEISILGSLHTIIYVNGKPPRGMLANIKNLIESLPPSYIKRIEVIREPGASVDGAYAGAIINIVMAYPWEGFAGVVNASALSQFDIVLPKSNLGLYYTKGKWSFAWSGAFNTSGDDDKNEDYYEYLKDFPNGIKSYINNIHYRKWTNVFGTSLFANYNFTERSTLGLGAGIGWYSTKQKNITTTTYTTLAGEEYERRSAIRDTIPYGTPNSSASLFYTLQTDDNGSNLDIVIGYFIGQTHTNTGMFYSDSTLYQKRSDFGVGWGGRAEYQHKFSRHVQLNVGVGFNAATTDKALDFYENSNRFIYKENMLHAFGEVSFPWHRTSFVVGLRVESEFNTGDVCNTGDYFKRNNTSILPSVSFDWQMPWHNQSLSASFSQRVLRPLVKELNPSGTWITENSYTEGNPHLKNHYYWIASLNYMCVKNIMFRTSFYKSFGNKTLLTLPDDNGVMATSYYDGKGEYSITASVNYSKELLPFWSFETAVGYTYDHGKYVCEGVKLRRIFSMVGFSVKSIFNFSKRYGVFGSIYYDLGSPFKDYNDSRGGWRNYLSVELRKSWNDFSVSLYAGGLIPMRNKDRNFDSDIYIAKYNKTNYSPSITLSFFYIFGNKQVRTAKARDAGVSSNVGI